MPRKQLRFGLVGCGLMGKEFASALARWCHFTRMEIQPVLTAICSGHESSFGWFQDNFPGISLATTDYRELLNDSSLDAVYISVPHNLHERMYIDALEAGKHLFGEKPFGIDLEANRGIAQACLRHPELVVRSVSQFPFFPGAQRIARMVREGLFGRILEVEAGLLHSSDLNPDKPINWKRMRELNGEYGCMGDLGLHVLHLPLRFGWRPANVRAILSKIVTSRPNKEGIPTPCDTWDNASLFCEVKREEQHFPMLLKMQRMAPGEGNSWMICIKGTHLSARFNTKHPRTLETMPYDSARPQAWMQEDLGTASVYPTITGGIFEFGFSDAFQQMIAAFCDQVHKGSRAELPFGCATVEEAAAHHEILTAALESNRTQTAVAL